MTIAPLGPECRAEVIRLLETSKMPTADLSDRIQMLGVWHGDRLVGVVGLEPFGDVGLLRSLAVDTSERGTGLGSRLVERLEAMARDEGIGSLYLLTTTAEAFFQRRGYACVPRESAPAAIRGTSEFSSICPASSMFMCKVLA